ncbi:hypothetical protein [Natrialbaceae archaeon AArc-T1-2]|uniref:hypothetical protein n=1 Tax=Natrialbaceae archaeon AArc-T1-2 TaxID=3053904 RepID=UPI00255AC36E|nr:hypothetical protein [Natrialbaceae archaeon AArc-T1-2]WIV66376.1 hypothetical protein QQ977_11835 [Natrialbaceae archaeon AArc-T1-2]
MKRNSGFLCLAKRSLTTLRNQGIDRLLLYGIRYLSWKFQFHRLVRSLPHPIATTIYLLIRGVARRAFRILNLIFQHKYTDADPYKLIFVDPSAIEFTSGASRRRGWVVDGEWDEGGTPFMHRTCPKAIEQRFVEGVEWGETDLSDKYDRSKFEERTSEIEQLYKQIRDDEYKSQRQLLDKNSDVAWSGLNDAMHPLANEIAVDIGRDGELLWNMCGQHRLAIAKVLDIDRIPVQVFRRHADWQAVRDRARRGEDIPEELRDHPDLTDVLGSQ